MKTRIAFVNGWPFAVLMAGVLYLAGCASSSDRMQEGSLKAEVIAKSYINYRLMTHHPVSVDPFVMERCGPTFKSQLDEARVKHGPHANAVINVLMNELAAGTFTNRALPYPVGSVIVKQKLIQEYYDEKLSQTVLAMNGVGGMIKRAPGYDPANGDWEYFYLENSEALYFLEKPKKIESGRLASCVACHAYAHTTDHVYGTWQQKQVPPSNETKR